MGEINLQLFCSTNPVRRTLLEPFSIGEFSYAADGHIAVRVPRRADVPVREDAPDARRVFFDAGAETFVAPGAKKLPKPKTEECYQCDGDGKAHDCPNCNCACATCAGTGRVSCDRNVCVTISGMPFALALWRRVCGLPGFKISPVRANEHQPLQFRFDGGEGAIMGLRSRLDTVIELLP